MSCLDDNTAAAFVEGLADRSQAAAIEAHLEGCAGCRGLIVGFARAFGSTARSIDTAGDSGTRPLPALQRGERLDRYVIIECVGTGAMSVVYSAYDPELDRKVALKVMRANRGQDRLLIEARAIAKLSHPHVVSVFDARVLEGELFLAMELVVGPTLRGWIAEHPRSWRAALELCVQAGRGLAAAHRAGIVHRDLKPENVLVAGELAKVADFGLAMHADEAAAMAPDGHGAVGWPTGITRTGAIIGTPLYMAPELMDGGIATPGSDQYALCVVLHEALLGARPFRAVEFAALLAEKREGPRTDSARAGVPRALVEAIRRGLAPDPAARWPSIDALLEQLVRDRRRAPLLAGGVLGLGVLGALALRGAGATPEPCGGGEQAIAATWNADTRDALGRALRPSDALDRAAEHTLARLDGWAGAWVDGYQHACRATRIDGAQSEALMDRRLACLEHERREIGALIELLTRGSGTATARALEAVDALRDVDACADVDALLRRPPPPDSELARASALRIAQARAHRLAGHYDEAAALAEAAASDARELGDGSLQAQAGVEVALALAAAGTPDRAEPRFVTAIADASAAADDEVAAAAWVGLVGVTHTLARYPEVERIGRFADAAIRRLGEPAPLRRRLELALGATALARGEHDLAAVRVAAAFELADLDADPIGHTDVLEQLARVELARGNPELAVGHMDRVLEIRSAELGAHHPRVADAQVGYGNVLHDAGRWADAAIHFRAAIVDLEAALGPDHPGVASARLGLAVVERRLGQLELARAELLRARTIRERALGPDHPELAHVLVSLANLEYDAHEYAAARSDLARALAIYAEHFDGDHPRVIAALGNLAAVDTDDGRLAEAEQSYRRVLAVRERKLGADHPEVAFTLANLGRVVARAGRRDEARSLLERAIAIAQAKLGERHPFLGFARESLAEVDRLAQEGRP